MKPLIALTTFGRTDRDMRRIVTLVTLLHGRLYRPRGGGQRGGGQRGGGQRGGGRRAKL